MKVGHDRYHALALACAALLFLLCYRPELLHFSLSLDEELALTAHERSLAWLQQGRWGMSWLARVLPAPDQWTSIHTLAFGCGLLAATWAAFADLRLRAHASFLFGVVYVGFPLWLHIAEFNTLAAGFGLALAAAAWGTHLLLRADRIGWMTGTVLIAFAVSVYQTLWLYALLHALLSLHARWRDGHASWREVRWLASGLFAGLLLYWLVQKLCLAWSGQSMSYVGEYLRSDILLSDPLGGLQRFVHYMAAQLLGKHPIYLSWSPGAALLAICWLGAGLFFAAGAARKGRAMLVDWSVLVLGVGIVAVPVLLSFGGLPARAHVAWPLLAAWMAAQAGTMFERERAVWLALALAGFATVATSIAVRTWRIDRDVRAADAELARELAPVIRREAGDAVPIRVTLAGRSRAHTGDAAQVEAFGASYFHHEGGNIYRVVPFMTRLGLGQFEGVWLGQQPALVAAQRTMPSWPAPGSVRKVDGVVIVKLGDPLPYQLEDPRPVTR